MKTIHTIKAIPALWMMPQEFLLVMRMREFFRYAVPAV